MGLWDWALGAYERPGVPQATLALQDAHGQNTSYLLWAVWAQTADAALLGRGAAVARAWDASVLEPLRGVRRALKPAFPAVGDAAREALRADVKAAELQAERVLMESLETLGGAGDGAASIEALRAAVAAWAVTAPDQALQGLADVLP